MSWQSYIDNLKTHDQSGKIPVAEAALCGFTQGEEAVWASSGGLTGITVAEIKRLASDRKDFGQCGPHIGGIKCRMIRDNMDSEGNFSLDLKTAADAEGNTYNVCVGKSKKALVIAKGTKEASGGQLSAKVFCIVDHLRKSGI